MKRRFEMEEGGSSKFWEIAVEGAVVTVSFGRIGTAGQTKPKDLGSAEAAAKEAAKLVGEKTRKGYVEVGAAPAAPQASAASAPVAPAAAAAPAAMAAPAPAATAPPAPAPGGAPAPASPLWSRLYVDGAHRDLTWACMGTDRRRRVDPGAGAVIAALVRGWAVSVRSRDEAEALLARVRALPAEPPQEPAALLAYPGWEIDEARPRTVVIGAILAARSSDSGPESQMAGARGPGGAPASVVLVRRAWADGWLAGAFAGVHPGTEAPPSDYLVAAGDMGDAYLVAGTLGGKVAGLPFARRTADSAGKKHSDGIAGVLLAHAAWDESPCVRVDLSEAAIAAAMEPVAARVPRPLLAIAASYDSRS